MQQRCTRMLWTLSGIVLGLSGIIACSRSDSNVSSTDALTKSEVAAILENAGFPKKDIPRLVCTAQYESGFKSYATNINKDGSWDVGLMQINDINHDLCGISNRQQLKNTGTNARCAFKIYQTQGMEAWNGYLGHRRECDSWTWASVEGKSSSAKPSPDADSSETQRTQASTSSANGVSCDMHMVEVCKKYGGGSACTPKYCPSSTLQSTSRNDDDDLSDASSDEGSSLESSDDSSDLPNDEPSSTSTRAVAQNTSTSTNSDYDSAKAQRLASAAKGVGASMGTIGYCYEGSSRSMDQALGTSAALWHELGIGARDAYQFADWANANPSLLKSRIGLKKISGSAASAPIGAVLVYSRGQCGFSPTSGHIEIAVGGGRACSDHCRAITACPNPNIYIPVR